MDAEFYELFWFRKKDGTHLYLCLITTEGYQLRFDVYQRVLYLTNHSRMTKKLFNYVRDVFYNAKFHIDLDTNELTWEPEL